MAFPDIKICSYTGPNLKTYLPSIIRLRIEVLREYPYLCNRTIEQEREYLKKYKNCNDAIAVIVFDGSKIVGTSIGIPLRQQSATIQKPFLEAHLKPASYFYFGESFLLKNYRGRGIGHHFYDLREQHVQNLKKFQYISFCPMSRPEDHPQKPVDYIYPVEFWRKRGYVENPELKCTRIWQDTDQETPSEKQLTFWIKPVITC